MMVYILAQCLASMPEILVVFGANPGHLVADDSPLSHLFEVVVEAVPKL